MNSSPAQAFPKDVDSFIESIPEAKKDAILEGLVTLGFQYFRSFHEAKQLPDNPELYLTELQYLLQQQKVMKQSLSGNSIEDTNGSVKVAASNKNLKNSRTNKENTGNKSNSHSSPASTGESSGNEVQTFAQYPSWWGHEGYVKDTNELWKCPKKMVDETTQTNFEYLEKLQAADNRDAQLRLAARRLIDPQTIGLPKLSEEDRRQFDSVHSKTEKPQRSGKKAVTENHNLNSRKNHTVSAKHDQDKPAIRRSIWLTVPLDSNSATNKSKNSKFKKSVRASLPAQTQHDQEREQDDEFDGDEFLRIARDFAKQKDFIACLESS